MSAVEMKNITKSFGTLKANDSIHLKVNKGNIHAIVGENGAGKTTLMNILYGIYHADEGEIYINDTAEIIDHPAIAIKLGIGMVHQHFMLVKPLTVLENIILGQEKTKHFGFIDYDYSINKINKLTKEYRIKLNLKSKIENLTVGLQQRVEILKILYREADILILDEPTAVLTPQETDELFNTLKNLAQKGKTIILITHKLSEVMS
ncbi:MAG: ATP-binding cassette domain-containing protein, partial [Ignavibacteria bacterium]